jgi:hypothetical protein
MEKDIQIRKLVCLLEDENGDSYCVSLDEEHQVFAQLIAGMCSRVKPLMPIEPVTVKVVRKKS